MVQLKNTVLREQMTGDSKLDFLVDGTYIEVKTPLLNLQLGIPQYVKQREVTPFSSIDRFCKHVIDLKSSLKDHR